MAITRPENLLRIGIIIMLLQRLEEKELINPPTWLVSNTQYLTMMGSIAYGVSSDNSDLDVYGVTIPHRHSVFPHEAGYIDGFGQRPDKFNQWQQHHIFDQSACGGKGQEYDFSIYNIVNYFKLCMENNPNMVDSLFVRRECIMHITAAFEEVRRNRKMFLHKGVAHKLRGYAFSQLNKAKNCIEYTKEIREFERQWEIPHTTTYSQAIAGDLGSITQIHDWPDDYSAYMKLWDAGLKKTKRFEGQKIHGQDNKFLYHVFRLADQAEFILTHHDLDLQEDGRREKMKAIRRGDISYQDLVKQFGEAEKRIDNLYQTSSLRHSPNEEEIKNLLLTVLEHHFGSIDKAFKGQNRYAKAP